MEERIAAQPTAATHAPAGSLTTLVLSAIGVVFGDIGTSPLYTFKEAFSPHYGLTPEHDTVLGILSLIFWALLIVVTLKYVVIIMRADNDGEGGIMALMSLVQRSMTQRAKTSYVVGILGIFGASLFFGDGVITPAISVLGAVEGLEVAAPQLHRYIVPIAVIILLMLFASQRHGTAIVGRVFGPVCVAWFLALAAIGIANIVAAPEVLLALNPWWGMKFFATHGLHSVLILGAVVLAVTGGEALYADMGHFGARPIRLAWTFFVLPSLLLNYLGQGALLLTDAAAVKNPFFMAVPDWARFPMIGLATAAAVIASQAVITGAFSVARQAMQLGYLPRLDVRHTSRSAIGQVYLPGVNRVLMLSVIALVIAFGSSTALASAYGVSVSGTMLIDTILLAMLARAAWPRWRRVVVPLCVVFAIIDVAFLIANGVKLLDGAWFPIVLGIVVFTLMRTWRRGRETLGAEVAREGGMLEGFLDDLLRSPTPPHRAPGTAVFMARQAGIVPHALVQNLRHNKVLHRRNLFVTVETANAPYVAEANRTRIEPLADGAWKIIVTFGFMERPDVPMALALLPDLGGERIDVANVTYFASHQTVVANRHHGMPIWRDRLYALMHRNAAPATNVFCIPGNRLVELGATIEI